MSTWWTRLGVVAAMAAVPCLSVSSASADECQLLDPTCVVDDVVDGDETVDGALDTVDETIGAVTDAVDPAEDAVDDVTGGGGAPSPDGNGDPDGDRVRNDHKDRGRADHRPSRSAGPTIGLSMPVGGGFRSSADPSTLVMSPPVREHRDVPERFAAAAEGAVKSLLVVFVLLGVAVGFVLIQDRLDKSDPKLALAPLRSDMVPFD